jgi:hypothetical protein
MFVLSRLKKTNSSKKDLSFLIVFYMNPVFVV